MHHIQAQTQVLGLITLLGTTGPGRPLVHFAFQTIHKSSFVISYNIARSLTSSQHDLPLGSVFLIAKAAGAQGALVQQPWTGLSLEASISLESFLWIFSDSTSVHNPARKSVYKLTNQVLHHCGILWPVWALLADQNGSLDAAATTAMPCLNLRLFVTVQTWVICEIQNFKGGAFSLLLDLKFFSSCMRCFL